MWTGLLTFLLVVTSLFLILLVLIQRGRGGGLAGAFGGLGGQSAFGAKAGDLFTRVTIGVAAFWIILCIVSFKVMGHQENKFTGGTGGSQTNFDDTSSSDDTSGIGVKAPTGDKSGTSSDSSDKSKGTDSTGDKKSDATGKSDAGPSLGETAPAATGNNTDEKAAGNKGSSK
jgi:preprotein translocase subunit SecG